MDENRTPIRKAVDTKLKMRQKSTLYGNGTVRFVFLSDWIPRRNIRGKNGIMGDQTGAWSRAGQGLRLLRSEMDKEITSLKKV